MHSVFSVLLLAITGVGLAYSVSCRTGVMSMGIFSSEYQEDMSMNILWKIFRSSHFSVARG